jgi:hypothetical protein
MSAATDLLAASLGSLRRIGLLLAAFGAAVLVTVAASGPASSGPQRIPGGASLQLAETAVPADSAGH